jgi:hypothetical protein
LRRWSVPLSTTSQRTCLMKSYSPRSCPDQKMFPCIAANFKREDVRVCDGSYWIVTHFDVFPLGIEILVIWGVTQVSVTSLLYSRTHTEFAYWDLRFLWHWRFILWSSGCWHHWSASGYNCTRLHCVPLFRRPSYEDFCLAS